jgi:outer membrane murein-binding lipoprotein Lpp
MNNQPSTPSEENQPSKSSKSTYRDRLERNIFWFAGGTLVAGCVATFSTIVALLNFTGQTIVQEETYENLKTENQSLQAKVAKLEQELFQSRQSPRAEILEPENGAIISVPANDPVVVKGKFTGNLQGKHLWLFVRPWQSQDWYPQSQIIFNSQDKSWEDYAYLPDPGKFEAVVVIAERAEHEMFDQYLKEAETKGYPPIRLPGNVEIQDKRYFQRQPSTTP